MAEMIIRARCPECRQKVKAKPVLLEKPRTCPKCKQVVEFVRITDPIDEAATPPDPSPIEPSTPEPVEEEVCQTKSCPFCSEAILATAAKCKHCGEFLDGRSPIGSEQAELTPGVPICRACGDIMKKATKSYGGTGCLFVIAGILLCLFVIGALVGLPMILIGILIGIQRKGVWRCRGCSTEINRKIGWLVWKEWAPCVIVFFLTLWIFGSFIYALVGPDKSTLPKIPKINKRIVKPITEEPVKIVPKPRKRILTLSLTDVKWRAVERNTVWVAVGWRVRVTNNTAKRQVFRVEITFLDIDGIKLDSDMEYDQFVEANDSTIITGRALINPGTFGEIESARVRARW